MSTGDRSEHRNQHEEDRARRERIAKQRNRIVPAGEVLGHDPRTDYAGEQEERTDRLRCDTPS